MGIKQVKLHVDDVVMGMFVSGLDKPWTQSPFPLQGFYVRTVDHIEQLRVHCRFVFIDVVKGAAPINNDLRFSASRNKGNKASSTSARKGPPDTRSRVAPLNVRRDIYRPSTPLKKEILKARDLHLRVHRAIDEVVKAARRDSHSMPLGDTQRVASAMVDSIIRNPDAFGWLSRVRDKDEHTYSHSVRSAIWAILFGRSIGLPKPDLDALALGVLLKDIGKARLPRELLEVRERSEDEQEAYERFVQYGVAMLRDSLEICPRVISVVKTHCEKINGGGFPQHLCGDKIPLLGKIAGIVTFYDEVTNPRDGRGALSPSKAVAKLYEARDTDFQEELVVEFIRAIGIYPTGTLVELSSGDVAVVVEQSPERRLKPKVMVVVDAHKKPLADPQVLDLSAKDKRRQDLIDAGKCRPDQLSRLDIVKDLEPGAHNLDSAAMCKLYLEKYSGIRIMSTFKNTASGLFG